MIWTIDDVRGLLPAFTPAGEPDQAAIDAYLAHSRRPIHSQKQPAIKRWYYVFRDDARVSLATVGMPLEDWQGGAMAIVGTREIIGEFASNRQFTGRKGLLLKLQPIAWLKEPADRAFRDGQQMLEEISFQVLDLPQAERVQAETTQKYQWKPERAGSQGDAPTARRKSDAVAARRREKERIIAKARATLARNDTPPAHQAFLRRQIEKAQKYLDEHPD
jgi:hypothetical protein